MTRGHVELSPTQTMIELTASPLEYRDPLIGCVLQDRYRIERLLGRGGMGVVYLAEHVVIQRKLAIKLLHSPRTASAELVERFHREARAAAAAGDEHIVDVTDMGRLDDGTHYMVMEYLEGANLASIVEQDGPLELGRALDIGIQICDALSAVHAVGIVHRDLKPENVVLTRRRHRADFVKLLDFGICKVMDEAPLTATGVALGTPQFMAPEQLEARPEVDHRADIYALGAMLFFALSGRNAFVSESLPQLVVSIWSEPPPRLRDLVPHAPEALERTIARALEKHPNRRFNDVRELSAELGDVAASFGFAPYPKERGWASESGLRATPRAPEPPPQLAHTAIRATSRPRSLRRSRGLVLTGGAVLAVSLLIGVLYLLATSIAWPAREPTRVARKPGTDGPAQPTLQTPGPVAAMVSLDAAPAAHNAPVARPQPERDPVPDELAPRPSPRKQRRRERSEDPLAPADPPALPASAATEAAVPAPPPAAATPSLVPSPAQIKPVF